MSASITNGNGPELDGKSCAVVNTNTGASCVSVLGTPIVRSRYVRPNTRSCTHRCPQWCVVKVCVHRRQPWLRGSS